MYSIDVGHLCITRHETDFGFVTFQAISLIPSGNVTASGETCDIASHVQLVSWHKNGCDDTRCAPQYCIHWVEQKHHMIIWGSVTELPIDLCGSTWIVQYSLVQQYTIEWHLSAVEVDFVLNVYILP